MNMKASLAQFLALLALSLPSAQATPVIDIRQGLIAYWPLDEVSPNGTTPDKTPFGNNLSLTLMSAADFAAAGVRGNAATFNGTSQLLTRTNPAAANNGFPVFSARRYTVMLWVKGIGSTQQDRRVFSEGSTTNNQPLLNIGTDSQASATLRTNVVDMFIRNTAGTAILNHGKSTNNAFDGTWHHIAWVDNDGVGRLYIDGQLDQAILNYTPSALTLDVVAIGGIQRAAPGSYFGGMIDEVAVWERPLAQAEIQNVMNNGIVTPIPDLPPLLVTEPVSQTLALGDNAAFTSRVVGNRPFTYQWLKNDVENVGANSAAFAALNVLAPAQYSVRVTNPGGTVTSSNATVTVIADPPANLRAGIISYWPFNTVNEALNTTPDLYSNNDMQLMNMTSAQLVPGNTGLTNALSFDGISQYCQRTTGFPLYNNPAYSLSIWVKGDGTIQTDRRIFSEGSTTGNNPLVTLGTATVLGSTSVRPFIRNDAGTALLNGPVSARPVLDNTWHHLVWVDSNGVTRLYIDGTLDTTSLRYTRSGTFTLDRTSIGAVVRAAVGNQFAGTLDEVATWNRALSYTEVQSIYTNGVPPPVGALPVVITKQPVSRDVFAGDAVQFSVEATGSSPIQFQWRKGNADIEDATNSTLIFVSALTNDAGSYSVRVSNAVTSTNSVAATLIVYPLDNVTSGLIAHWPLDIVDGTTTPDLTTNGNHLTLVNMDASNIVGGTRSNAFQFNGTDEVAVRYTTNSIGLPLYSNLAFTVSLWVNGLGTQLDRRVFSEGSTTNNNPLLNIGTDNLGTSGGADLYIRNNDGGNPVNHRKTGQIAFDGTWHHIVYVDNNGTASVFVDGTQDGTSFNYTRGVLTPDTISLGGIVRAATGSFYAGMIDDVAVWRRALKPAEVQYVKQNGPVPPDPIRITDIQINGSAVALTIYVPNVNTFYCVKQSTDITLPQDQWPEVTGLGFDGPFGNFYIAHFNVDPGSQRFFRVYQCD